MQIDTTWLVTFKLTAHPQRSHEFRGQLLGAVEGLLFLHSNGVVHGALRPVRETLLPSTMSNTMNRVTY